MNWFAWRQSRKSFMILGLFLVIYAAFVIPTGIHFWHVYQNTLADCRINPANPTCSDLSTSSLFPTVPDRLLTGLIPTTIIFLPIVLGVFWGAPLLAREYADGTNSLVWTQSVSRRKWLTVKLIWALIGTVVIMAAFAALVTWWLKTLNDLDMDRFANGDRFGIQGIVPVATGLFAVAYGIMFGAWFRKTMVAVGVTVAMFVIVSHIVIPNLLRPNYMKPITVTAPIGPDQLNSGTNIPRNAWVTSQTIHNGSGQAVLGDIFPAAPAQCQKVIQQQAGVPGGGVVVKAKAGRGDPISACLNKAGWHQIAKYQPDYRFWGFQEIESGIYIGLSAIAVAATYWLVLKRDA